MFFPIKTLIRLATALIPAKRARRSARRWLMDRERDARLDRELPRIRRLYAAHECECRKKLARGERLKIVFLLCDASMFSAEPVYAKMKDDSRFECSIVIAPRVTRGDEFLRETQSAAFDTLSQRYGKESVSTLFDPNTGRKTPVDADIVFSSILYEDQSVPECAVSRLAERSLVAVLYYGYGGLFISNERKTPHLPNVVFAWRYFVSNEDTRRLNLAKNPRLADNMVVTGYAKMDRLAQVLKEVSPRTERKCVLLCPHHTIDREADGLALSTFLERADFFLRLPEKFPDVDFVFRPHPLLFPRLATPKWWGKERTDAYRVRLEAFPNVEFQQGGDYFATFAGSDAMIHDCGSFLAEYFYTGKPQCYLLTDERTVEEQFLPPAKRMLEHSYKAFTDEQAEDFVRRVVVEGIDPGREERGRFARETVCVNHPDAAAAVVRTVMDALKGKEGEK